MSRIATYTMRGWPQATTAVVGFGVLALMFPPFSLLSGAALALVALRLDLNKAIAVLVLAVAATTILSMVTGASPFLGAAYGLMQWLPLMILAVILRKTVSLPVTLQIATVGGMALVLGVHAMWPGAESAWQELLDQVLRPMLSRSEMPADRIDALLGEAARLMTGRFVTSMVLTLALMLFIARWWQARLYNPGGFREEFTSLNIGKVAAIGATAVLAFALLNGATLPIELSMVAMVPFFLQGVAIVHYMAGRLKKPLALLVAFYTLLVILPQAVLLVCVTGLADTFADFRAKIGKPKPE